MLVRKNEDGSITYPYSVVRAKKDFPNVSFTRSLATDGFRALGIYPVDETPRPGVHGLDMVDELEPVLVEGRYRQVWSEPVRDNNLVSAAKSSLIARVKAEANRRILAILPEWKQRNYTARAVEKLAAGEVGDDEWSAMSAAWTAIKAVRVASDAIEAEISTLTDEQVVQYDVANNHKWPA